MSRIKRGSKKYKEVVEKGCGLEYFPYTGDYDCNHGYEWYCEDCPITLERIREDQEKNDKRRT